MFLFENEKETKKVCIWKDEEPFHCVGQKVLHLGSNACDVDWYAGTICIEARLNPHHASNYAMVCMKYTPKPSSKTDIFIRFGKERVTYRSKVIPFNKSVHVGLNKEFVDAIEDFFDLCNGNLPCGTIEIIGGAFDEVGSSYAAFQKVMEILSFAFLNIEKLNENQLKSEVFKLL